MLLKSVPFVNRLSFNAMGVKFHMLSTVSFQHSAFMLPSKPNLAFLRLRWNHQLADGIKNRFVLVIFSLYWILQFVISNFPFLPFWSAGLRRVVHCTSLNPHMFSPPHYAENPNVMDTLHPLNNRVNSIHKISKLTR